MKPSREPALTDYYIDVPDVGRFSFARRKMADEMKIAVEYSVMTQGIETPSHWLGIMAGAVSQLRVLTVSAPDGWDIDEMDPLDEDTYAKILKVHRALVEKEHSFRRGAASAVQASGQGNGAEPGVLVPAQVQPSSD